jgi:hypothetical protein
VEVKYEWYKQCEQFIEVNSSQLNKLEFQFDG